MVIHVGMIGILVPRAVPRASETQAQGGANNGLISSWNLGSIYVIDGVSDALVIAGIGYFQACTFQEVIDSLWWQHSREDIHDTTGT